MTDENSSKLLKLRNLLRELFQLDQADLDFGIYRIMNQKRDEVERFLDDDLLPQVRTAFEKYRPADKAALQAELDKTLADLSKYGVDPDTNEAVLDLRKRLTLGVDVAALEDEVFSDLFTFFRRYYHGGDFLSLRRYKKGVYAIPYEGEEVKLHWANQDQYYIKSSEYLANYVFKVGPPGEKRRVRFELTNAGAEQNNNKAQKGNERRFILSAEHAVVRDGSDLVIRFEYRPDGAKQKQIALNIEASARVFAALTELDDQDWRDWLGNKVPTKKNPERTLLDKHLRDYTAKNSFDYFIHKDLGGFLRRELDFFIKNEVLLLDDIDQIEDFAKVEEKLSKIRVLRAIAHKIIAFLAQLEDFQKKLWLKKKFVVETNWCITLDRIPEELYPEIAANEAQCREWVWLFAIDEIEGDMVTAGYSAPLSIAFLQANGTLLLDTGHFSHQFKERLLGSFEDLSQVCRGTAIQGVGAQAISLARATLSSRVSCVFIDPPYNTGNDEFPYKDGYPHSSWLSMALPVLDGARAVLQDEGALWCTLDSTESPRFWLAAEEVFGEEHFLGHIAWQHSVQTKGYSGKLAVGHNNVFGFSKSSDFRLGVLERTEEHNKSYANPDSDPKGRWRTGYLVNSLYRPNLIYDVQSPSGKVIKPPDNGWRYSTETMRARIASGEIYFSEDETRLIRKIYLRDQEGHVPNSIWLGKEAGTSRSANLLLKSMLPDCDFSTVKPPKLIERLLTISMPDNGIVLDCFAGSGTTAAATMSLNDKDGGRRQFFVVEMAAYFDTVLVPRLKKETYAKKWKDGKPVKRRSSAGHGFRYLRLESYEDALDNLELRERTGPQQQLLATSADARQEYMLSYMLDVETRGSASLLNIEQFKNPFEYKLKVTRNNETKVQTVDLVETFNYLIGLRVQHMAARVHRTAEFERDEYERLQVKGSTKPCQAGDGWTFRVIEGQSPDGERALVIWRVLTDDPEKDNLMLDTFCKKMGFSTKDLEFELIYVNGDNNLENLRRDVDTWKVRLIEESFHRLMFDVQDL